MSLIGSRSDQLSTNGMLSRSAFIEPEHLPISDLVNAALAQKLDYKLWARQQLLNSASLLLDFENNRYVRDEGIEGWMTERPLTDLLTFSRAGSATGINRLGILETVGTDVPVFENSGLRLRPAETNLLAWSRDFTQNTTLSRATLDATETKQGWVINKLVCGTAGAMYAFKAAAVPAGRVTASGVFMSGNSPWVMVELWVVPGDHVARFWFNTSAGAVGTVQTLGTEFSAVSPTVEALGGGLWRLSVSATLANGATVRCFAAPSLLGDGNGNTALGDYGWCGDLQLNAGDPIPYIPTTSAAVTRPADDARISGNALAGIWNPNEGAILLDLDITLPTTTALSRVFVVSSDQHPDAYTVFADASGLRFFTSDSTGRPQPDTRIGFISSGRHKLGINRKADGSIDMWLNGGKAIASASAPAGSATIARFAGPYSGNVFTPMLYRRAALFSEALDDQQMEILTS